MDKLIVINFKTYEQSTGENALNLAKICDEIARETKSDIIVVPQFADIYMISKSVNIPVFAQHFDNIKYGSNTGHVLVESLKSAGASGSLLNHSENRLKLADIEVGIEKLKSLKMKSIVCTNNVNITKCIAVLNPDFVAVEPPELIGTGISVSKAQPDIVRNSVNAVKNINPDVKVLCGAGISNGEDVKKAIELGTNGVLLASGIVCAKNPREVLIDLVKGLR